MISKKTSSFSAAGDSKAKPGGACAVAIIGAGFSGLTLAWALNRLGVPVEIFEKTSRAGGLLQTERQPILAEAAANALLANEAVEILFEDLQVTPIRAGHRSNKRWIYRGRPRQMPLSFLDLLKSVLNFLVHYSQKKSSPRIGETLYSWCSRVLSVAAAEYLVSPAMRGIYAVSADQLSASLVLAPFLNRKNASRKRKLKGSVNLKGGFQELVDALEKHLRAAGVPLQTDRIINTFEKLKKTHLAVVIATEAPAAGQLVATENKSLGEELQRLPRVDLSSVNIAFAEPKSIRGFGCLFPADQHFYSMGVLFNSDIFENRSYYLKATPEQKASNVENETWITSDVSSSNESLIERILIDRERLTGQRHQPLWARVNRWPRGLPLYGSQLETWIAQRNKIDSLEQGCRLTELSLPVYLTGNYLGHIGLARILDYNLRLADRIQKEIYAVSYS